MPKLLDHHRADLAASGLTDETIAAAGIYSETDHHKLAGILNRKNWPRKYGPAVVYPYLDESGAVVLQRVKPDNPPKRDGKVVGKYLSPTGAAVRAYVPPMLNGELADANKVLLLTEGEKKSLAAVQAGLTTIGLSGVDCWHTKKSSALLSDLERVEWKARRVFIVFDSDAATNENVRDNESLLADALSRRGATVKVVRLPPGPDGAKVGLDDYLVAHGVDELWKLLNAAEEAEPPSAEDMRHPAAEALPEAEAASFLAATACNGRPTIAFWRDTVYRWHRGAYRELTETELRAAVTKFLNARFLKVTGRNVADTVWQIKAQTVVSGDVEPPTWLAKAAGCQWPTNEIIVTKNKIVHLPALFTGEAGTVDTTPLLFSRTALGFDFADGNCPQPARWLQFLGELWGDDAESVEALQLWFGLCLVADTSHHKLLLLIGPRRSGKGTIARVLGHLVGKENVAAPTLSSFSQNFGLAALVDKTLAIVGDLRLSNRPDGAVIVERILSITGEDAITVDRKFLAPITSTFPTRLMLLSNELPRLFDASGALVSRMIVLKLTKSFYGVEDKKLTASLLQELPSILWWSIGGWWKLQDRGSLLQPASSAGLFSQMEDLASPVGHFLRECCEVGGELTVARHDLYAAYREWCEDQGRKKIEDEAGFGRNLRAVLPCLGDSQPRVDGKPTRHYVGVGLKVEWFE
jgi:putative DNA primase/helicase